jgi:predicted lipid-binding transport protein (Tim44 family)
MQQPRPAAPVAQQPAMAPQMAQQPGFFQRNPFMAGMMGGLVGAGIGSMLFGHSPAMAGYADASPGGAMLGTLLQIGLIALLAWLAFRLFRRRFGGEAMAYAGPAPQAAPKVAKEFEPSDADKQAFAGILTGVQQAWSAGDIASLRRFATPEIVSWLSEDLTADSSRGVRNVVEDVRLLKGDVIEAWREGGREYATAVLTFSARDYSLDGSGKVVEGDPKAASESTEAWTFVRANGGGWLLSAIERG